MVTLLLSHAKGTAGFPLKVVPGAWGSLGVTMFFVLSGFLITKLILDERTANGTISLRLFYLRRGVRIFPAAYTFILVVLLLQAIGVLELGPGDALAASTYTMNFHARREWWLGHMWSLAVEEQFYLLWPAAIAFLGVVGGLRLALGAIAAAPLLRVAVFYGWPAQRPLVDQAFPLIFDGLATGCALAILRERLWQVAPYRRCLESPFFAVVPVIVVVTYLYCPSVGVSLLAGQTLIHVGLAACIDWAMRFPESWAGRALNCRAVVWLGTVSYSLYLWQQLFLNRNHTAWHTTFPQNLVLAFAAAASSYYLVERPLNGLRARLSARPSSVARATGPAAAMGGPVAPPGVEPCAGSGPALPVGHGFRASPSRDPTASPRSTRRPGVGMGGM
jgi:peptidoglycan/LPS O-acetylase OafA/YrhL